MTAAAAGDFVVGAGDFVVAARPTWFLGFDCATKTFAFSLSRVDLAWYRPEARARTARRVEVLRELARRARQCADFGQRAALVGQLAPLVDALDAETREAVLLADGETAELLPGVPDADISTVERLRAVCQYVRDRVRPAVAALVPLGEPLRVVVEYQNINPKTRPVAAALITLFIDEDVFMVGPALKNKVAMCEAGRYCYFTEQKGNTYRANKAHAVFNFEKVELAFGTHIPASTPLLRGHIADSFMQVLGYILYGPEKGAEKLF